MAKKYPQLKSYTFGKDGKVTMKNFRIEDGVKEYDISCSPEIASYAAEDKIIMGIVFSFLDETMMNFERPSDYKDWYDRLKKEAKKFDIDVFINGSEVCLGIELSKDIKPIFENMTISQLKEEVKKKLKIIVIAFGIPQYLKEEVRIFGVTFYD